MLRNFLKALAAVAIGNAVYFLLVMPLLPARGHHEPFRLDLGLLIDFWICVLAYALLARVWQRRRFPR